jgi:GNAT superfamily N-acetyltransferase
MIRPCTPADFDAILAIINAAAIAYRGVIPADRWHEPYMAAAELRQEIERGVVFWGYEAAGELAGVMGVQPVQDVTLIRHAYTHPDQQRQGLGGALLATLQSQVAENTSGPLLVGTWAAAAWAIRFYEKHGFRLVSTAEKERLLRRYWTIPERQVETSVVLADENWFRRPG